MINIDSVNQITKSSISERIKVIEILLRSVKSDIEEKMSTGKQVIKPFRVRKFGLGQEVHFDRNDLYGICGNP